MPSLRSLLPIVGMTLGALLQPVTAAAMPRGPYRYYPPGNNTPTPAMPASGDPSELPAPTSSMALAYVTLGRGVQNYTCATSDSSSKPVAIGAIATLYDVTALAYSNTAAVNALPSMAVYTDVNAVMSGIPQYGTYPVIGNHYFNASGTPTFNLTAANSVLWGAKTGDIKAPSTANAGPAGTGAVDWLYLTDKGGSYGVEYVYRIETAGGAAPADCSGQAPTLSVQYAADYWFYKNA